MPGTLFTTKERERLAGFPEDIPHWDLITYCTLTEHDRSFIDTYHGETHRLGAALQLRAVRYLGFCRADLQAAPVAMVAFLASLLQVTPTVLQTYGRRRMTRGTHFNAILHHLGFRRVQPEDHASMLTWLTERALEHDTPTLLFQTVCEHLKQQHLLRPKEAHRLRRPNGYFDFLDDQYSYVRQFAPPLLDSLSFASHRTSPSV